MESDKVFEKIDRLRRDKNYTVYFLCKQAGISHSTFHNWENRKTLPKLDVLSKLCEVLNITLPELLFDSDKLDLTAEQKRLLEMFSLLDRGSKDLIFETMKKIIKD